MSEPQINNPSQPPKPPRPVQQKQIPVLLICPWCSSVHVAERETTIIFQPFNNANKYCLNCVDVPLLLFGLTPGSWADLKIREVSAGIDQ